MAAGGSGEHVGRVMFPSPSDEHQVPIQHCTATPKSILQIIVHRRGLACN